MKSGELKESELIAEATEIMNKMKNMPGMDNIQAMLSKMGMGGMAGMAGMAGMGGKVNMGAMEAQLNSRMKMAKTKERIRAKAEANEKLRMEKQNQPPQQFAPTPSYTDEELLKLFGSAEKVERTPRGSKPQQPNNDGKKKKKGKK
jgi:hypothetical protein